MMMTWSALDLIVSSDLQYGQKMMVSTQPKYVNINKNENYPDFLICPIRKSYKNTC